ncbi:hypothetical protein PM082_004186 [Marasmius tenuissimus]|nr:hypothetical protein PM082_004186 [Marasmius tenuissimus]
MVDCVLNNDRWLSLLTITMAPVMSTLIPTVEVFSSVNWRKWSKGLSTYAMINEFYDHYTNHNPEPDAPEKPTEPSEPKPTTRTVTIPAHECGEATLLDYGRDLEQYAKDLERYGKDFLRHEKDHQCWKKYEFKAMGALHATTTIAVQSIIKDDDMAWNAWEKIKARYGQQTSVSVWADCYGPCMQTAARNRYDFKTYAAIHETNTTNLEWD